MWVRGITSAGAKTSKADSVAVNILAEVVRIDSKAAADHGVVPERPGEADTGQEDIANRFLQGCAIVLGSEPQRS